MGNRWEGTRISENNLISAHTGLEPYERLYAYSGAYYGVAGCAILPIGATAGKSGALVLSGILSFQGCTANQCLPPKKQEFTLALEVV